MNNRSSKHQAAQRNGRKRDLQTCQICGSTIDPQGHHMFYYSEGGAPSVDNIVTLCKKCHHNVHNGNIDLYRF